MTSKFNFMLSSEWESNILFSLFNPRHSLMSKISIKCQGMVKVCNAFLLVLTVFLKQALVMCCKINVDFNTFCNPFNVNGLHSGVNIIF